MMQERRYWAFVANPTRYDIARAVREYDYDTWMTKQSDVRAGDRALIWKSLGRSPDRGIIAFAEVLTDPSLDIPDDSNLWMKDHPRGAEARVAIQYVLPPNVPVWANLATESVLSQLSVWKGQGTVFHVTPEQWDAVVDLAGGWPDVTAVVMEREAHRLASAGAFDPFSAVDARMRVMSEIVRRQGQPEFRARLLDAYGARCAMTGCDVVEALEAAHIVPYRGASTNDVTNGLLLRADLHVLFDRGLIAVNEVSMSILLAPRLKHSQYGDLDGRDLRLPASPPHGPSTSALREHRLLSRLSSE